MVDLVVLSGLSLHRSDGWRRWGKQLEINDDWRRKRRMRFCMYGIWDIGSWILEYLEALDTVEAFGIGWIGFSPFVHINAKCMI